ncbi:type I-U CRISPR-associated protein Cas5/Cas6 [Mycobacterium sp. SM1]|uniref:type I-G CRISPR-associated protein Csb2 n=1 Tax=Mycobacterium sp. SM1 TaxID=2816243 RepID=UPI001BCFAEBD|nr:type I-U CRISPR-associated protein Csb2 [Mycobacterium sp. SM1]MBS4729902.1 type I-U CRISPR-associated protein Cas5/Cas6 [Mycobacterium sp. SM1]
MPTTLVLTFPLGRYHATPWERHVNEGAVELPPSPWRLLRMLYAVWQTRCPDITESAVHHLLSDLAVPPTFYVPAHNISHSRHYYPDAKYYYPDAKYGKDRRKDRTLDSFAVFGTEEQLGAQWPVELEPDRLGVLLRIAKSIPYFGRADSICIGEVEKNWNPTGHAVWKPLDVAERVDNYVEVNSVLTPEIPLVVATLLARPAEVRRRGLRFPVGSRLVPYGLESRPETLLTAMESRRARTVTAVRFDLLHAGLPPETDAVIYTDLIRQAAIKHLGEIAKGTMLGGKTSENAPMKGGLHAHYLPILRDRRLIGLLVWVPGALPDKELSALCGIRALYDYRRRVRVRVSGVGIVEQVAPELVGPARTWCAVTPFTPARYPKKNRDEWRSFVVAEIQRELELRGRKPTDDIEFVDGPWTAFVRHRPSARMRGDKRQGQARLPSEFLRLRFKQPTQGPLTLGWLSHFGLGLFTPEG